MDEFPGMPAMSSLCTAASPSAGGLRVVEIDAQSDHRWEAFVAGHPEGSVFHHPAWLQVLAHGRDVNTTCLACEDSCGQLHGILPLLETHGFWFNLGPRTLRRRLSSLPRTPFSGPLVNDPRFNTILVKAAMERLRRTPGVTLELKVPTNALDDMRHDLECQPWKDNFILQLPNDPAQLRFGSSVTRHRIKWAVNKATKLGVQVRRAETETDLRAWYELYLLTMRWHGALPRPYRFFVDMWQILRPRGLMRLLLAEHCQGGERQILAGYILLTYARTVHCYVNGRRAEALSLHPNDILQWEAIHDACKEGFRLYNFLEVQAGQVGLAEYKTKWGAQPVRSYRYYYPAIHNASTTPVESQGRLRARATAAWRHMPLKTTELLSNWVHGYL